MKLLKFLSLALFLFAAPAYAQSNGNAGCALQVNCGVNPTANNIPISAIAVCGVRGDGITDDRAAINTCLATYSLVYFPPPPGGFYRIGSATGNYFAIGITNIQAGGTGYVVGDINTLTDGTTITVASVNAGVITAAFISAPKTGDVSPPSNPVAQSSTTGVGSGATFNLVFAQEAVFQPAGTTAFGLSPLPGNTTGLTGPQSGTLFKCDLGVVQCWTISGGPGGQGNLTSRLAGIVITRAAGTQPAFSRTLFISDGYNVVLRDVGAYGSNDCLYLHSWTVYGIAAHISGLNTGICGDAHIVADSWPELYVSDSRLGMNGTGDINGTAYLKITGGTTAPSGLGPNTLEFSNVQWNQAAGTLTHAIYFTTMLGGGQTAVIFNFVNNYIAATPGGTDFIGSDATVGEIDRLSMVNTMLDSNTTIPCFGLNAGTVPVEWQLTNDIFACSTLNLAPTVGIEGVEISNSRILGTTHFTGVSSSIDTASLIGNNYGGNVTLDGAWKGLNHVGNSFASGTLTNNATGNVFVCNSLYQCSNSNGLTVGGSAFTGNPLAAANNSATIATATFTQYGNATTTEGLGILAPNLTTGNNIEFQLGRDGGSNYDIGFLTFNFSAAGSTSNSISLGMLGASLNLFSVNGSGTSTFTPTGTTHTVLVGADGTYGSISFNGVLPGATEIGIEGGGGSDKNLYLDVPTGGQINFDVAGVNVGSVSASSVALPSLASSAAALDAVCWNATGGAVTHNAAGALCSASLEELKDISSIIDPHEALDDIMNFKPFWAKFKDTITSTSDHSVHPMFGAHQISNVDPRLAVYDDKGQLLSVDYVYMSALLTAAMQDQQHQITKQDQQITKQDQQITKQDQQIYIIKLLVLWIVLFGSLLYIRQRKV